MPPLVESLKSQNTLLDRKRSFIPGRTDQKTWGILGRKVSGGTLLGNSLLCGHCLTRKHANTLEVKPGLLLEEFKYLRKLPQLDSIRTSVYSFPMPVTLNPCEIINLVPVLSTVQFGTKFQGKIEGSNLHFSQSCLIHLLSSL